MELYNFTLCYLTKDGAILLLYISFGTIEDQDGFTFLGSGDSEIKRQTRNRGLYTAVG